MTEIRQRFPRTREKSQGTLTAYSGDSSGLADELTDVNARQRIRTYSETAYDEIIGAIRLLGTIRDSVTIIHGPPGCGAVKLEDYLVRGGTPWLITNIEENDSILGADDKLDEAVERAYRLYRPRLIFIISSPVVAINNDDIVSVTAEKSAGLGIPVIPIFSAGFRSKAYAYGYDLAYHALIKYALGREASGAEEEAGEALRETGAGGNGAGAVPAAPFINVAGAAQAHTGHIAGDLAGAGVNVNWLAGATTPESLGRAVHAAASLALDDSGADYLLRWLDAVHSVPRLGGQAPVGLAGTERWLLAAAGAAGSLEAAAAYIAAEKEQTAAALAASRLDGVTVFIDLPPDLAFGVLELVLELGGKLSGLALDHADRIHTPRLRQLQERLPEVVVYVQQGQPFEKVNVLGKLKPDLYIGRAEDAIWAARAGYPAAAVDSIDPYGFAGARVLAESWRGALGNQALSRYLRQAVSTSYRAAWLGKSANWHIKQEVK
ncbi:MULTISPECIES: nitrogenase component 1 [unclassified Paenibacillus]|uniref:nitrogenase component 1 n=1 Tax=unclassified Paenibacillus TaxID=185978 RepID=UPI0024061096|nr:MULTISPECIES: nitrogenase component 1 [unclassified Paenibacillus]MDF9844564.1 nitrogenase molybdenum-cofactor synthesis protein NifE [Paenibacillus sp. PastF-2]MDF9851151.1 nitrogenase molybdenum-cofactor synthesis protein NifE [Paenibacillus sp. PastM-2]MDF9856214.1 nitrogenase molybdenum-cofactor synthesis protein NifE [Paenibacillus sp. PastF-1]MDH6481557.1 nitrogenase molybdenum-cofactor synthesis protein NifE [Paenibacillus sp. PastH-2]MDH6510429.1 nitrogenase molybdenum-cofactor synt